MKLLINKQEVRPCECSKEAIGDVPVARIHWNGWDIQYVLGRGLVHADTIEVVIDENE